MKIGPTWYSDAVMRKVDKNVDELPVIEIVDFGAATTGSKPISKVSPSHVVAVNPSRNEQRSSR